MWHALCVSFCSSEESMLEYGFRERWVVQTQHIYFSWTQVCQPTRSVQRLASLSCTFTHGFGQTNTLKNTSLKEDSTALWSYQTGYSLYVRTHTCLSSCIVGFFSFSLTCVTTSLTNPPGKKNVCFIVLPFLRSCRGSELSAGSMDSSWSSLVTASLCGLEARSPAPVTSILPGLGSSTLCGCNISQVAKRPAVKILHKLQRFNVSAMDNIV